MVIAVAIADVFDGVVAVAVDVAVVAAVTVIAVADVFDGADVLAVAIAVTVAVAVAIGGI